MEIIYANEQFTQLDLDPKNPIHYHFFLSVMRMYASRHQDFLTAEADLRLTCLSWAAVSTSLD